MGSNPTPCAIFQPLMFIGGFCCSAAGGVRAKKEISRQLFRFAFSRLYLYVHFSSDALASVVRGIAIGAAAVFLLRKRARL